MQRHLRAAHRVSVQHLHQLRRQSNFLLWQCAYSEFYFTNVLWPDFTKEELRRAIASYQRRSRRYGGLQEDSK